MSLWLLYGEDAFKIKEVQIAVNAESQMLQNEYQKLSLPSVDAIKGQMIWDFSLGSLAKNLVAEHQWIKSIDIQRQWPGILRMQVTAHRVSFVILGKRGHLHAVVETGQIISGLKAKYLPVVPVVTNPIFLEDLALRKETVFMLASLPEDGELTTFKVSDIYFHPTIGFELIMRESGQKVILGVEEFAVRAERASTVMSYLVKHQLRGRVIDSRFSKKVLVRPRNPQ